MPIRIQTLFLDDLEPCIAPPEIEYSPCHSQRLSDLSYTRYQTLIPESVLIYGGTSASIALTAQPALIPSPPASAHSSSPAVGNWSTALQNILDRPPASLPNHLIIGGAVFCAAFATWAMVGQIDEVGRAQGRLIPQGEPYKVHPVVSGKMSHVYVQESQSVKAGQMIAELDNQVALNRVQWSNQQHASYEKELLEVEALIHKTGLETQVRSAIANAEIKAQEAAIAQAQAKVDSQSALLDQAQARITTGQTLLDQLQQNAAVQQERIARFEYLVQEGALAREQLFQAQEQFGDRQRTITQQTGEIEQANVDVQRFQADLQQAIAESDRLRAELAQKYAEGQEAQLQAQQTVQQLMVQKAQLQTKIQQSAEQLTEAKTELEQLALRAPVDGVVSALDVRKSGEVVQPGQTIAEIAPQNAPLTLIAALPTTEAGLVKVGDRAQVKFDAYPYQDYGIISGRVKSISPDAKVDERVGAVYRVEIVLDRTVVTKDNQMIRLKAGQTATAEIVVRRRRIAEVLLDPLRQLQKSNLSL